MARRKSKKNLVCRRIRARVKGAKTKTVKGTFCFPKSKLKSYKPKRKASRRRSRRSRRSR